MDNQSWSEGKRLGHRVYKSMIAALLSLYSVFCFLVYNFILVEDVCRWVLSVN